MAATAQTYKLKTPLTEREQEIAKLVARGLTNAEIGDELGITTGTVGVHLEHIYKRTGHPNRAALAIALLTAELRKTRKQVRTLKEASL
jgi:DNA-binding NarL/FixJ family response regulator